jgi:Domain of unknown function (DUF4386)
MASDQKAARTFGILFLITFATSIPSLGLYQPLLDDPAGYIAGAGNDNQIFLGAFLELLLVIANVATAVVLFPILRRQNEACVDEKSQIQALDRSAPVLPLMPGVPARQSHDYIQHRRSSDGSCGIRVSRCTSRRPTAPGSTSLSAGS